MQLSTLPPGLFVVDGADMQIKKVTSGREFVDKYFDKIWEGSKWIESREDIVMDAAIEAIKLS